MGIEHAEQIDDETCRATTGESVEMKYRKDSIELYSIALESGCSPFRCAIIRLAASIVSFGLDCDDGPDRRREWALQAAGAWD